MVLGISAGHQQDRSSISYEVPGDMNTRVFGVFLALGAIAFAFGDTVLPEIQVQLQLMSAMICLLMVHAPYTHCTLCNINVIWVLLSS